MAHFAELNASNEVINVIVVSNEDAPTEEAGIAFIKSLDGISDDSTWKQTSYNTDGNKHPEGRPFRKNYGGIGMVYDAVRDAFIASSPYSSWVLNETTCQWEAPVARPSDDLLSGNGGTKIYGWDEDNREWKFVVDSADSE